MTLQWRATMEGLIKRDGRGPAAFAPALEVGCGAGARLDDLLAIGFAPSSLHGVDALEDRVAQARDSHPDADIRHANAVSLPWPDHSFGLVLFATVFSSIGDRHVARAIAAEATRVVTDGGAIVVYDVRYPSPYNRGLRPISTARLRELFPGFEVDVHSLTLLPPLARRLGRLTPILYDPLAALPPLRSHLLAVMTRPAGAE